MRTHCDCLTCLTRHSGQLLNAWNATEEQRLLALQDILALLAKADPRRSPPDITSDLYDAMAQASGDPDFDPYRPLKDNATQFAWQLRRHLDRLPGWNPDSFEARVRLAIAGNILDFSVYGDLNLDDALAVVRHAFDQPIDTDALQQLQRRIADAHSILYLLDNCGEAVLDGLLIDLLRDKVTLAVRGRPTSNDVTRRELAASGLDGLPVVDNGLRLPGVVPSRATPELRRHLESADLIIAKGQGNFECLNDSHLPCAFLFMAKCPVVCREINAPTRSLQIRFA